jgi:hypothetical protein
MTDTKTVTKRVAHSLLAFTCLLSISTRDARADAVTRHTLVVPGICVKGNSNNFASATFSNNSLTLVSSTNNPNKGTASAIVTSTTPNIGLNNFPINQGTLTFTAVNNTPKVTNAYSIVAFYQTGTVVLKSGNLKKGTTNFSVNTVTSNSNLGQLLAVTFFFAGEAPGEASATVSNFFINDIPTNGFDLSNEQTCGTFNTP